MSKLLEYLRTLRDPDETIVPLRATAYSRDKKRRSYLYWNDRCPADMRAERHQFAKAMLEKDQLEREAAERAQRPTH